VKEKDKKSHIFSEFYSQPSPDEEGSPVAGQEGEDINQALTAKAQELNVLNEKYLRLAAEFENYKRLAQKDQQECARFANEKILKELLPIIDNLERAVRSAKKDGAGSDSLIRGVELTLKQFAEMLNRFGIRQMTAVGKPFDPAYHQAVARVESATATENTVVEEHQKGYLLHERILRPAMVTVAGPSTGDGRTEPCGDDARDDF
jgi:molecular chaperone GrpE